MSDIFMKDAYIYDPNNSSIESQLSKSSQQSNMTHGMIVDKQVLTASEANVYTKVMRIVDDNKKLKQCLQQNAIRLKKHVEELTTYKEKQKWTEEQLRKEIEDQKKTTSSIQKKLESAYEASGMNNVKKKIQEHLNALQSLVESLGISEVPVENNEEANIITDTVQAITENFEDGYVVVTGPTKIDVILKESKEKLREFHSENAEKALRSIEGIEVAIQESGSGQFGNDNYFQKFVEQKTSYETLFAEHQHLAQVQKENDILKDDIDSLRKENSGLKEELIQKSEKIKSLENLSVEFKMNTSDESKLKIDKLEEELVSHQNKLENAQKEVENLRKHNQQLQNDLKENSETFELTDQKCMELEDLVEKLNTKLAIKEQANEHEEKLKLKIRELEGYKVMLEEQKQKHDMDKRMYKKRENKYLDEMDQLKSEKNKLKCQLEGHCKNPVECEPEILLSTESDSGSDSLERNSSPVQSSSSPVRQSSSAGPEEAQNSSEIIVNLQSDIVKLNETIQKLEKEKQAWQQNEKNAEKEALEAKNTELEEKIRVIEEEKNLLHSSKQESDQLGFQMEKFEQERKRYNDAIGKRDEEIQHLNNENEELKNLLQNNQHEINGLRKELHYYSQEFESTKQNLEKTHRDSHDTFRQLQEKSNQLQDVSKQLQEATAQYFAAQSVIEKLRDESSKYKGQLKLREMELHSSNMELKEEKETLEILRVQVRVYENDFNAERAAREKQSGELQQAKENVESLRAERDQLRKELNRETNQFASMLDRQRGGVASPSMMPDQHYQPRPDPSQFHRPSAYNPTYGNYGSNQAYYGRGTENQRPDNRKQESQDALHRPCPKCNELFPDVDTLQIHVIECIDD